MDDCDIYGDLDNFDAKVELDKKSVEWKELNERYQKLCSEMAELEKKNKKLTGAYEAVMFNFNTLLHTAHGEIRRKDETIAELRRDKDNVAFRRKPGEAKKMKTKFTQTLKKNSAEAGVQVDLRDTQELPLDLLHTRDRHSNHRYVNRRTDNEDRPPDRDGVRFGGNGTKDRYKRIRDDRSIDRDRHSSRRGGRKRRDDDRSRYSPEREERHFRSSPSQGRNDSRNREHIVKKRRVDSPKRDECRVSRAVTSKISEEKPTDKGSENVSKVRTDETTRPDNIVDVARSDAHASGKVQNGSDSEKQPEITIKTDDLKLLEEERMLVEINTTRPGDEVAANKTIPNNPLKNYGELNIPVHVVHLEDKKECAKRPSADSNLILAFNEPNKPPSSQDTGETDNMDSIPEEREMLNIDIYSDLNLALSPEKSQTSSLTSDRSFVELMPDNTEKVYTKLEPIAEAPEKSSAATKATCIENKTASQDDSLEHTTALLNRGEELVRMSSEIDKNLVKDSHNCDGAESQSISIANISSTANPTSEITTIETMSNEANNVDSMTAEVVKAEVPIKRYVIPKINRSEGKTLSQAVESSSESRYAAQNRKKELKSVQSEKSGDEVYRNSLTGKRIENIDSKLESNPKKSRSNESNIMAALSDGALNAKPAEKTEETVDGGPNSRNPLNPSDDKLVSQDLDFSGKNNQSRGDMTMSIDTNKNVDTRGSDCTASKRVDKRRQSKAKGKSLHEITAILNVSRTEEINITEKNETNTHSQTVNNKTDHSKKDIDVGGKAATAARKVEIPRAIDSGINVKENIRTNEEILPKDSSNNDGKPNQKPSESGYIDEEKITNENVIAKKEVAIVNKVIGKGRSSKKTSKRDLNSKVEALHTKNNQIKDTNNWNPNILNGESRVENEEPSHDINNGYSQGDVHQQKEISSSCLPVDDVVPKGKVITIDKCNSDSISELNCKSSDEKVPISKDTIIESLLNKLHGKEPVSELQSSNYVEPTNLIKSMDKISESVMSSAPNSMAIEVNSVKSADQVAEIKSKDVSMEAVLTEAPVPSQTSPVEIGLPGSESKEVVVSPATNNEKCVLLGNTKYNIYTDNEGATCIKVNRLKKNKKKSKHADK